MNLNENGLIIALKKILANTQQTYNIKIIFNYDKKFSLNNNIASINLFCIVLEAINNIIKHSKAEQVIVDLIDNNDKIILRIIDNGIGFILHKESGGFGIINMNERARLINAKLKISAKKNIGTQIECLLNK